MLVEAEGDFAKPDGVPIRRFPIGSEAPSAEDVSLGGRKPAEKELTDPVGGEVAGRKGNDRVRPTLGFEIPWSKTDLSSAVV